jgi:hypothetical protein
MTQFPSFQQLRMGAAWATGLRPHGPRRWIVDERRRALEHCVEYEVAWRGCVLAQDAVEVAPQACPSADLGLPPFAPTPAAWSLAAKAPMTPAGSFHQPQQRRAEFDESLHVQTRV